MALAREFTWLDSQPINGALGEWLSVHLQHPHRENPADPGNIDPALDTCRGADTARNAADDLLDATITVCAARAQLDALREAGVIGPLNGMYRARPAAPPTDEPGAA